MTWYWWLIIIIAVIIVAWLIVSMAKKNGNEGESKGPEGPTASA